VETTPTKLNQGSLEKTWEKKPSFFYFIGNNAQGHVPPYGIWVMGKWDLKKLALKTYSSSLFV
jgi:hypothetical protein